MKVIIYGSNPHFANLPSSKHRNVLGLELSEEKIDYLTVVKSETRVKPFLLALLHFNLSLTAHVVIRTGGAGADVIINYLFTHKMNEYLDDLFILGEDNQGKANHLNAFLFPNHTEVSHNEEFWLKHFLTILQDLCEGQRKRAAFSLSVVQALNKAGLSA